jgi:hypothetical protein
VAIEKRKSKSSPTGYAYRVRYPDIRNPGRLASETFWRYEDAQAFDANWKVERRKGALALLDAGKERLGDYILDDWGEAWKKAAGRGLQSQKTRKTKREVLKLIDAHILRANGDGSEGWATSSWLGCSGLAVAARRSWTVLTWSVRARR